MPLLLVEPSYVLSNSNRSTLSAKPGGGIGRMRDFKYVIDGRDTAQKIYVYSESKWLPGFPAFITAGLDLRIKGTKRDWGFELGYRHGLTATYSNLIVLLHDNGRREQSVFTSNIGLISAGVKYYTRNKKKSRQS